MLATFTLCAGFLLSMAEPQKAVEPTPTVTQKTDGPAADQSAVKPTDKTAVEPADKTEGKPVEKKAKEKAIAEKSAEKPVEAPKNKDNELLAIETNVVSFTNSERARYGLPPLEVDKQLMRTAREHCSWMTWNRIFQHTRRPVAENIAMGQPSSRDVVRSWMNSSGHRANILNPSHRRIGVGAYRTASGTIYWVQQFSR